MKILPRILLISISLFLFLSVGSQAQTTINLAGQCNCEVISGNGTPITGSPPALPGTLYIDNNTGNLYSFDGTSWTAATSSSSPNTLIDADGDTWVDVERTTDEDIIQFTTAGNNYAALDGTRLRLNFGSGNVYIGDLAGNGTGIENASLGRQTLSSNTTGGFNVAIGSNSLRSNTEGAGNIAIGYSVLRSNITGDRNVASGLEAMEFNTTGTANVAMGYRALRRNTIGGSNTAIGSYALQNNEIGGSNTALGNATLQNNTTGNLNTAIGNFSLGSNTTGISNIASGPYALLNNTTGNYNVASGLRALANNVGANYNVAIGYQAMQYNVTGSSNTAIGPNSFLGSTSTAYTNSTALGSAAFVTASNQARIGNSSVTSIGGYASWTNVSDARFKTNVKENVVGLDFINKLRPVSYNLDMNAIANQLHLPDNIRNLKSEQLKANQIQTGFIAQEVEKAANGLGYNFSGVDAPKNDGDHYGLRYAEFTVPLVKAVQELSAENQKLIEENAIMRTELDTIKSKLDKLKSIEKQLAEIKGLLKIKTDK